MFSVTAKSIEPTSSKRVIDAKGSKGSSPFVLFNKASSINAAFEPLGVISIPSDDIR